MDCLISCYKDDSYNCLSIGGATGKCPACCDEDNGSYSNDTNLKNLLSDKTTVKNLLKLYYFRTSSGNIKNTLESSRTEEYRNACKFVNECVDIFRELKEKHCPEKTFKVKTGSDRNSSDSSSSPVCYQLEEFFDKYETVLYKALEGGRSKHNKMSSLEQHPDAARVRCNLGEDLYYTPFFNIFKYNSRRLTPFGSIVFLIFFMLFMILMMHILVKFTPIGDRINPRGAHVRRKWRDIQAEIYYPNSMDYYGDGSTSDASSMSNEGSTFYYSAPDGSSMSNDGSPFYYSTFDGSSMSNEGSTFYYSTSDGTGMYNEGSMFGESSSSFSESSASDGSSTYDSRSTFYYNTSDDETASTDGSFSLSYRSARR
ncbi:hypothetical protein C922_05571 [Plasmodium inui San Antonio 1]|uniref:PIR Superfamily Protein n=1 Tax=Plasmodium inui San Antonio 1 TaxID=1237626 RepID=W6ZXS5_9APIC|nr:hypothetical protein C922_05571 [Plasmodium inui San Antonio 1]EUD64045.1 hypothetical protein C922_05571 [Plasmodium inui San Antonio 1]